MIKLLISKLIMSFVYLLKIVTTDGDCSRFSWFLHFCNLGMELSLIGDPRKEPTYFFINKL